jgi:hypothetical protein
VGIVVVVAVVVISVGKFSSLTAENAAETSEKKALTINWA